MNPFNDWTADDVHDALGDMEFTEHERDLINDMLWIIEQRMLTSVDREEAILGRIFYRKLRDWAIANAGDFDLQTHADGLRERAKDAAIVAHIKERRAAGQPVLVGTTSVERSEHLAAMLTRAGVPHNVLNAKQHDREATVVAQAGRSGAVTIATNMAGRGTDIVLGGNAAGLASESLRLAGKNPAEVDAETYAAALATAEAACAADRCPCVGATWCCQCRDGRDCRCH